MKLLSVICLLVALVGVSGSPARHIRARRAAANHLEQHEATPAATFTNWAKMTTVKPTEPSADAPLYVWPQPQSFSQGTTVRELSAQFQMVGQPSFDDLTYAIARFQRQIFDHRVTGEPSANALKQLNIVVKNPKAVLQLETDESYSLTVPTDDGAATLTANTLYGALHGLETFSQLVSFNFTSNTFSMDNLPLQVDDAPRFPHRGILLDTSRHYHSIPTIHRFIDSMAMSKYNVFHWHLSDIQSFPYHSPALPRLSMAAYSNTDKYSISDVAEVVEYARLRGVRTMIEFDVPGHAQSWCVGYPEVCPAPDCQMPIDPSQQATFDLMKTLFTEVTGGKARSGLFPEDLFHLGGDEVDLSCWTKVDRVKNWLAAKNMTTKDAYRYVVEQAHDLIYGMGRTPIGWDEIYANFGKTIDPQTVIHVWRNEDYVFNSTRDGFRTLVSPDGPWYLDGLDTTWQQMYNLEPHAGITNTTQQNLVLGGESCMWSETVDDSDVFNTVWPRAAAVAERLWSPRSVTDTTAAEPRYANFRCLLNRRGIGAAPYANANARTAPNGPGPCLKQ